MTNATDRSAALAGVIAGCILSIGTRSSSPLIIGSLIIVGHLVLYRWVYGPTYIAEERFLAGPARRQADIAVWKRMIIAIVLCVGTSQILSIIVSY
jgi:hypothetical protein